MAAAPTAAPLPPDAAGQRPVLPPDIPQFFAPAPPLVTRAAAADAVRAGRRTVRRCEAENRRDPRGGVCRRHRRRAGAGRLGGGGASRPGAGGARARSARTVPPFQPLPAPAAKAKNYPLWAKQLAAWVAANESVELFRAPSTGEPSHAGEPERDFRARLQQASRESRDEALDRLRRKYAPKQAALDEKLRRAQQTVQRETRAGHRPEAADGDLGRRHAGGRAVRAEGVQRQHHRPCHHRRTRRRPRR